MAIRYGIPVSEFLARHTSPEITELWAFFALQQETSTSARPVEKHDPEEQTRLLKSELFKGGR